MFTLHSIVSPRILMREFDMSGGVTYDQGNNNLDFPPLHPTAQARQLRVLAPLLGIVASLNPGQYHAIAALMRIRVQRVINLAEKEVIEIGGVKTTILQILADSTLHHPTGYSVVGHEQNEALQVFVGKNLGDTFKLNHL